MTMSPPSPSPPHAATGNGTSLISPVQPHNQGPEHHKFVGINALIFVTLVGLCMAISYTLKRHGRVKSLPDSSVALIIGGMVGLGAFFYSEHGQFTHIHEENVAMFQPDLFYFILLPPIIFEAGFNLHNPRFFRNIFTIVLFAVVGTMISVVVVAAGLYHLAQWGLVPLDAVSPLEAMLFASLISAIDPVGTMTVLMDKQLDADRTMTTLVFGESVLNDAVSIVIFNSVRRLYRRAATDVSYVLLLHDFATVSVVSIIIGLAMALSASFLLNYNDLHEYPEYEFITILFFSYGSYLLAEIGKMSGIFALFVCGVVMSHYAWHNVSTVVQASTKNAFASFAHISETFVYCYLGITCTLTMKPDYHMKWSFSLTMFTLGLCIVGRAVNIFGLSFLANLRRDTKVTWRMQVMLWFAGLRGAIAFALALNTPTTHRAEIITTTMTIVILTTLVMGGLTERLVRLLSLQHSNTDNTPAGLAPVLTSERQSIRDHYLSPQRWYSFDALYMKPWFGGNPHPPDLDQAKAAASVFADEVEHDGFLINYTHPYLPSGRHDNDDI